MKHNARNTDPNTSHRAAGFNRQGRASHCQRMLRAFARGSGPGHSGYTDAEAAAAADLIQPGVCWWHRASDLRANGWIEWARHADGTRMVRPGEHGTSVGVSVITERGRRALA